jgi:hypothetical protein
MTPRLWYIGLLGTTIKGVGKRTSVYLSDGLAAAVEASGVPLAELIRRGLAARTPGETRERAAPPHAIPTVTVTPMQPPLGQAPERGSMAPRPRCPHPGTRMIGGWCRQCGVMVEPGGYLPG